MSDAKSVLIQSNVKKASGRFERYGLWWSPLEKPAAIEMDMIRKGGRWTNKAGKEIGNGLFYHYKRLQELIIPEKVWHKWSILELEKYLECRTICVLGPASTGKTFDAASNVLTDYYVFPDCTTGLCCSTTKERLEDRVWGQIKQLHKTAKKAMPTLPGYLIEGRLRLVTDPRNEASDGRDFRNGLIGVPAKKGHEYVGLGDFIGIKNKRVRVIADELSLLPPAFVHAISNLDKNPDLKVIGLGNPKDTTDALGVMAEPSVELGGWDGGIDQTPVTKTWKTRRPDGVAIQLVGTESPNLDGQLGIPLITQQQIDRDIAFYGRQSLWFTMFDLGMMPKGQGTRRVLTRQLCLKSRAMEQPYWADTKRTKIACLDAAYRGVGGDRCVFQIFEFGDEAQTDTGVFNVSPLISQKPFTTDRMQLLALTDTMLVPIDNALDDTPEEQIVAFVRDQCRAREIPAHNFFYDSGMRTSLVSRFGQLWSPDTCPIDCGGKPTENAVSNKIRARRCDHYSKFITELWFSVRLIVEAGQFRGMTEELLNEFCAREWTMVAGNKIEVEPKEKMKEKTGRSPDLADCAAIGCYGATLRGFSIDTYDLRPLDQAAQEWQKELAERSRKLWRGQALTYS